VRQLQEAPGNLATYLLRRADGDRIEITLLSFWNSIDAVRAMAGEDVEQVELHPEDARFLVQSDPAAIHYEIERVRASSETEGDLMTLLQQYLVRESGES
jgi:heme-degrading monooxygenase HmoA